MVGSIDCLIFPDVCALYNPPVVPTVMIASINAWTSKRVSAPLPYPSLLKIKTTLIPKGIVLGGPCLEPEELE